MRNIIIQVQCDHCKEVFSEDEADNVEITVRGEVLETDLCGECLPMLLDGLRHKSGGKPVPQTPCPTCDRKFRTPRGLQAHQTKMGHG